MKGYRDCEANLAQFGKKKECGSENRLSAKRDLDWIGLEWIGMDWTGMDRIWKTHPIAKRFRQIPFSLSNDDHRYKTKKSKNYSFSYYKDPKSSIGP